MIHAAVMLVATAVFVLGPVQSTKPAAADDALKALAKKLSNDSRLDALEPDARARVGREIDAAVKDCEINVSLKATADCPCFVKAVFERRLKEGAVLHQPRDRQGQPLGEPYFEPAYGTIVMRVAGSPGSCGAPDKVETYLREAASKNPFTGKARADCAVEKAVEQFTVKPVLQAEYVMRLYGTALGECRE